MVSEVCRNLSSTGAEPLALTDCLNFGNPERPDIYYQLEWCVRGMAHACRFLGVPVVSGNVSLYNESQGQAIYPTPIVGGLGLLEDVNARVPSAFPEEGLAVYLLGQSSLRPRASDLAGSEILQVAHQRVAGRPSISLPLEQRVQALCRQAIAQELVLSAHDCSEGGLAVALAECAIPTGVGFLGATVLSRLARRWDCVLFGERQSRIAVTLRWEDAAKLRLIAAEMDVPVLEVGHTGGNRFRLEGTRSALSEVADAWEGGLDRALVS